MWQTKAMSKPGQFPPVAAGLSLNPARSCIIAVSVFLAGTASWLYPNVAWSEVVLVQNSLATQRVYLRSVFSDKYPSSNQDDCAPRNLSCMEQGRTGPVPDTLKASYANELRTQGLTVVMDKPSQGSFYEVSVSMSIKELSSGPPIVPKRLVCDVSGMIVRYGAMGKRNKSEDFDMPNKKLESVNQGAYHLALNCLKPAASVVREKIRSMSGS